MFTWWVSTRHAHKSRVYISTRVEKSRKMHVNSSSQFEKAHRELCRILLKKYGGGGKKRLVVRAWFQPASCKHTPNLNPGWFQPRSSCNVNTASEITECHRRRKRTTTCSLHGISVQFEALGWFWQDTCFWWTVLASSQNQSCWAPLNTCSFLSNSDLLLLYLTIFFMTSIHLATSHEHDGLHSNVR